MISGNDTDGIFVNNTSSANLIQGNYIGTDKSGTKDLGNSSDGIYITNASGNTIGGTTAASRNVVSGNGVTGIQIGGDGNEVLGNRVGTTASGKGDLGNDFGGVFIEGANNHLGDGTSGGANIIAFNGDDGVDIFPSGGGAETGNAISRNSIFSNALLGINLLGGVENAQGVTANDPGDADTGANTLQNKPVLSSAKTSSTKTTIKGRLNSTPAKTFKVQFFSNPSGNEGKTFLGQKKVTTGSGAKASFTFSPAQKVGVGKTITATATGPGGNTSEFSAPEKVVAS